MFCIEVLGLKEISKNSISKNALHLMLEEANAFRVDISPSACILKLY